MVPEVFVLCDGANDSHGKLNVLGAFDTIMSNEFPLIQPHCTIALRLRFDITEAVEQKVHLSIQDILGDTVLASVDATLKRGATINPTSTANLILNINSLRVEKPGDYSVLLSVEGKNIALAPLYVRSTHNDQVA